MRYAPANASRKPFMENSLTSILRRLEDSALLHLSESATEALARLHFTVEQRQGLVVLVGAGASGKTTLLRRFRKELAVSPACVATLNLAGLSEVELCEAFAAQIGLRQRLTWPRIAERLTELGYDATPLVVLIDEAQQITVEAFDFLARLRNADATGQLQLTLVVATDELSLAVWPAAWLQRVDLRVQLELWSPDDVAAFLAAALGEERKRHQGFTPEAVLRIHEMSMGLPMLVRRIARLSLLAAQGQERTVVDEATATGVSHELCGTPFQVSYDHGPAIEFLDDHFNLP
jgi:general secretion pathway protein A